LNKILFFKGTTLEGYKSRPKEKLTDMVGGGPYNL